jgi:hypothetical protein
MKMVVKWLQDRVSVAVSHSFLGNAMTRATTPLPKRHNGWWLLLLLRSAAELRAQFI